MRSHLGLVRVSHGPAAAEEDPLPEFISFEEFRRFFVDLGRDQLDLSASLCGEGTLPSMSAGSLRPRVDIAHATMIVPAADNVFCPPGQLFHQEWSLILGHLELRDLNTVNLVCRFFHTTLEKHPPPR